MKIIYLLLALGLVAVWPVSAGSESCLECHGDESVMKSLVEIPQAKPDTGTGPSGPPLPVNQQTYHKRYYVDRTVVDRDPHFGGGCGPCHGGDASSADKEKAHKGIVKRPSDDPKVCGECHEEIAKAYRASVHYTVRGLGTKTVRRLSAKERQVFADRVFSQSCRSCHAACGDCHVSSPAVGGIRGSFLKGHGFVKKDEGKTCAVCHGGRVYPEYTRGTAAGPDVHHQKGMACTDCHRKGQLHGDGRTYTGIDEAKGGPKCGDCHRTGSEKRSTARLAHSKHTGKVTCYGCHVAGEYRNCSGCHEGRVSSSAGRIILGRSWGDGGALTTLRQVPVSRDTFLGAGIRMENFDRVPDYRAAPVHNIRKMTERTRSCDVCHLGRKNYLTKESLMKNGSKANGGLIYNMPPLEID